MTWSALIFFLAVVAIGLLPGVAGLITTRLSHGPAIGVVVYCIVWATAGAMIGGSGSDGAESVAGGAVGTAAGLAIAHFLLAPAARSTASSMRWAISDGRSIRFTWAAATAVIGAPAALWAANALWVLWPRGAGYTVTTLALGFGTAAMVAAVFATARLGARPGNGHQPGV
jgi:hypothetical protein